MDCTSYVSTERSDDDGEGFQDNNAAAVILLGDHQELGRSVRLTTQGTAWTFSNIIRNKHDRTIKETAYRGCETQTGLQRELIQIVNELPPKVDDDNNPTTYYYTAWQHDMGGGTSWGIQQQHWALVQWIPLAKIHQLNDFLPTFQTFACEANENLIILKYRHEVQPDTSKRGQRIPGASYQ